MTVRDDRGAILNREAYSYEFDRLGNWTKMVTSLVVFENGELKREPVEVTYRTVTYYFDDNVAKIVEEPKVAIVEERKPVTAPVVPMPVSFEIRDQRALEPGVSSVSAATIEPAGDPPPLVKSAPKSEPKS